MELVTDQTYKIVYIKIKTPKLLFQTTIYTNVKITVNFLTFSRILKSLSVKLTCVIRSNKAKMN